MARLNEAQKKLLGEPINPFDRSTKSPEKKIPKAGEVDRSPFTNKIHDGRDDEKPEDCVTLTVEEIEKLIKVNGRFREKCFLWVIDEDSIKIIREKTPNTLRTHDPQYVCHTNLTGWGKAYVGGEMFFGQDDNIYINNFSDRYGNPSAGQWKAAKDYIKGVGYNNLIDILSLLSRDE